MLADYGFRLDEAGVEPIQRENTGVFWLETVDNEL